jgi:hypothetical protein
MSDGPTFVRFTPDGKWYRASGITNINVQVVESGGTTHYYLVGEGFGTSGIEYPSREAVDAVLRDFLETYGGLDLTD